MPYNPRFLTEIETITLRIEQNQIPLAVQQFATYTDTVQQIGTYSRQDWDLQWRKRIWLFGKTFSKVDASQFLNIIDSKINDPLTTNVEVLEFIKAEIIIHYLPGSECRKNYENLIVRYPYNPEFRHGLGHYYVYDEDYISAIHQYKLAIRIDHNDAYITTLFLVEQKYLDDLIMRSEYDIVTEYVKNIKKEKLYDRNDTNLMINYMVRSKDFKFFEQKLNLLQKEYADVMQKELESERRRVIEILGFFSAIVAFILSTVAIGKNFTYNEATSFIACLGLILLLFVTTISVLFRNDKKVIYKDFRFWLLLIGLIGLLIFTCSIHPEVNLIIPIK